MGAFASASCRVGVPVEPCSAGGTAPTRYRCVKRNPPPLPTGCTACRLGHEDGLGTNRLMHWCGAQLQVGPLEALGCLPPLCPALIALHANVHLSTLPHSMLLLTLPCPALPCPVPLCAVTCPSRPPARPPACLPAAVPPPRRARAGLPARAPRRLHQPLAPRQPLPPLWPVCPALCGR